MHLNLRNILRGMRPYLAGLVLSLLLPTLAQAQFPYGYRGYNVPNVYTGIDPIYRTGGLYYPGYSSLGYSGYGYPGYSGYGYPGLFRRRGFQLFVGNPFGLGGVGLSIGGFPNYGGYGYPGYYGYGYGYPGYYGYGYGYPGGYYQTYMRGYSFGPRLGLF